MVIGARDLAPMLANRLHYNMFKKDGGSTAQGKAASGYL
jgi:hypothetical protein